MTKAHYGSAVHKQDFWKRFQCDIINISIQVYNAILYIIQKSTKYKDIRHWTDPYNSVPFLTSKVYIQKSSPVR